MPTVNIHKAKTELSKLVDAIERGEVAEIIIARNGKPAARLAPLEMHPAARLEAEWLVSAKAALETYNARIRKDGPALGLPDWARD